MNETLEKTEGRIQRGTGNIGDTRHRTKTNKAQRIKRYLGEWNIRECRMNNTDSHWTQGTEIRQQQQQQKTKNKQTNKQNKNRKKKHKTQCRKLYLY